MHIGFAWAIYRLIYNPNKAQYVRRSVQSKKKYNSDAVFYPIFLSSFDTIMPVGSIYIKD
jgi:hypothetical protein